MNRRLWLVLGLLCLMLLMTGCAAAAASPYTWGAAAVSGAWVAYKKHKGEEDDIEPTRW